MHTPHELEKKFWKALKSDRTMMVGVDGMEDGHSRPLTAQIEGDAGGPIWFFIGKPNAVVDHLSQNRRAIAAFSAKGHDLFASVQGTLSLSHDRAVIDRLWNPFIAAWFEGKDDPNLVLLRFDTEHAEIWLNESNLLAGVKMLLGVDPKKDAGDKVAEIDLH
ncbi:MAG TPA: pyridoxamine 5'-phosphate oxidase family protein [Pseudoxanthomonas sp.]|nr:pyridoxamine 5'-phosphate oxidase family protein [Pseudoxanthomonas sp.]